MQANYTLPAEWDPHESTVLVFPHNTDTWPGHLLKEAQAEFATFVAQVTQTEKVYLIVNPLAEKLAKQLLATTRPTVSEGNLAIITSIPTNDSWVRDYGPITVKKGHKNICLNFEFNSWGGKYPPYSLDNQFNDKFVNAFLHNRYELENIPIIVEGGGIEANGDGLLITTESCLLNRNRGAERTKKTIETIFSQKLGIRKVIWLLKGIDGDDTDGHIDNFCRFVSEKVVAYYLPENEDHPDYFVLTENLKLLKQQLPKDVSIIFLPEPGRVIVNNLQIPASYLNFYICNQQVLVPFFGTNNDQKALHILERHFKNHKVVGIMAKHLLYGQGGLHCLSMQIPT